MPSPSLFFADRLCSAIRAKQTPLIVGLDPRVDQLPDQLRPDPDKPDSVAQQAAACQVFCTEIIDAVADLVPAVKPQAAFFEHLGPEGMAAMAAVIDYARAKGLLVIMDAKRGDIGSTATAYASAWLGDKPASAWGCDALTVNPYLGDDSLEPFVDRCQQIGGGIFVLVKTSNPGSHTIQERQTDGRPVYSIVADQLQEISHRSAGESGFGIAGAVVGATWPEQLSQLRQQMPNCLLLIPGFGAQGGTASDVAGGLISDGMGAVINSSRGIIFAYDREEYAGCGDWQQAVEQATRDAIEQLAADTPAGKLR